MTLAGLTESILQQCEIKMVVAIKDYVTHAEKAALNKYVQIKRGKYKDFYARVKSVTSDNCGIYIGLLIARKDRTGWILSDSHAARHYRRIKDVCFDVDPTMLKKLKAAYDNPTLPD